MLLLATERPGIGGAMKKEQVVVAKTCSFYPKDLWEMNGTNSQFDFHAHLFEIGVWGPKQKESNYSKKK